MEEFGINTPQRQAAFLAQLAHEVGSLRYVQEIASGAAYDNRADLGNTRRKRLRWPNWPARRRGATTRVAG
jgi:hypothetical protein